MDELEIIMNSLGEEELTELLNEIETGENEEVTERIKKNVALELFGEEKKAKVKLFNAKRVLSLAASLIVIVASAFALTYCLNREPVRTDLPTVNYSGELSSNEGETTERLNPLMLAITEGNDSLIDFLIKNTYLITKDVVNYSLKYIDLISYGSVKKITEVAAQNLSSTGLDGLLESAILGDSKRALAELRKRENLLMTPSEKLAFFFSVAFCNNEVVEEFLNRGYSPEMKDSKGNTLLEIAEENGNSENSAYFKNK